MAARYLKADVHGLYVVLELVHKFWKRPGAWLAREIRQSMQAYGLNPLDRRRLQWEIAEPKDHGRRVPEAAERPAEDPRKVLHMVAKG
jgi:hypothetical protein